MYNEENTDCPYQEFNPLCPEMIFECLLRISFRKEHSILDSSNQARAVEIVLKFVKKYDGVDFNDSKQLKQYFDEVMKLDFLGFRKGPSYD